MDHNLEDSLNLESDIAGMDFEHSDDGVVCQPDITLEATNHGDDIPMEFETIEDKQPMLMDTGGEEVIDFMGEQLSLQEYSIGDDQTSEITTTEESNIQNLLHSQSDIMVDLQFEPQTMTPISVRQDTQNQPKYIAVKVAVPSTAGNSKRGEPAVLNTVTRHVAIAPKPPNLVQTVARDVYPSGKQYAIAPKPVALISNSTLRSQGTLTKMPISGIVQANASKGNTVLAQVGKQLIMVPAGGSQKIKLVSAANHSVQYLRGDSDQAQLTLNKTTATTQSSKSIMAKVVVQGSNQPAVITKLMPSSSTASPQARYVMQQKTIPISIGNNKVLLTSPTKQGKKQVYAIKSTPGLTPIQPQVSTTKKVVITANPTQKVILKAASQKPAQVNKDGKVVLQPGQRSQLHKIDVPGKGIQFIRLITNPTSGPPKTSTKQSSALNISTKTLVSLTEKAMSQKPQQKFVRIAPAPASAKPQNAQQQPIRSGQSLLTPITSSSVSVENSVSFEEVTGLSSLVKARPSVMCKEEPEDNTEDEEEPQHSEIKEESKSALAALIADAVADEQPAAHEVEIEYEREESPIHDESTNSLDQIDSSARSDEHPLIVIPANYLKQSEMQDDKIEQRSIDFKFDSDPFNSFQSPRTPPPASDSELGSTELGLRPRKACNCTKSQCLKLYCDCFANGEFCNRCNCNNCHNNLENEELRQKAIRACLDRNPNAFRPKIGKSKTGGPEIIRRHNKGCNCKRSGCLKNYCECYEAKIACTSMCKCVGCRNVEESLNRARRRDALLPRTPRITTNTRHSTSVLSQLKQPCSFMTSEVIEAVCQCLVAAGSDGECARQAEPDPARDVIEEFARCLQDIISASLQSTPLNLLESQT